MMKGVTNKMDIWDIFIDFGLISSLLLVGVLLRSKVGFFQRSFMPASIIAGILGLILGTNGLGLLPFTDSLEDYPSALIAVVFASIRCATRDVKWSKLGNKVGRLWPCSHVIMILRWRLRLFVSRVILVPLFAVHTGFGLLLAGGFAGGHGTAAALGSA